MSAIVNALAKALQADPDNWETRQALIEVHMAAGDTESAFELLHEIEALPEEEASLVSAAQCYALVGSMDAAKDIAQLVVDANRANAEAHLILATIAEDSGDSATGMRHFFAATSLDSEISSPQLQEKYESLIAAAAPTIEAEETQPEPEAEAEAEAEATPEVSVDPGGGVAAEAEEDVAPPPADEPAKPASLASASVADDPTGPKTVRLNPAALKQPNIVPIAKTVKLEKPPADSAGAAEGPGADQAAAEDYEPLAPMSLADYVSSDSDFDGEGAIDDMHLKERQDAVEAARARAIRRDKLASLTVTVLLHVAIFVALALIVVAVPRDVPPSIVAMTREVEETEDMETTKLERTKIKPTSTASTSQDIVSVAAASPVAMSNVEFEGLSNEPSVSLSFEPSMSFGSASASMDSKMMFGQKIEGDVLGVILDVSGSMAEYLPMVIREVDKNFKNAPICYVNHGGMLGGTGGTDLYPVIEDEVTPTWTLEDGRRVRSPYWFLWGDLPRKAPQKSVDRLIGIFKDRPNMFIARGGRNLIGAASEFLIEQECDSVYIFSDWEDFVDKEYCEALGQKLGRNKLRTYVQPAAARTDHLHTVSVQVANRTKGRELPPLTMLLRPDKDEQVSLLAKLEDEKKVPPPEGVKFATPRETRDGLNVRKNEGQELKVVEYPNFDIVLAGPQARAFIYLKTPEGYIQNPIVFGYHSHKPYVAADERIRYRTRKWLRNVEEPKYDGKEFVWDMVLEDEIQFKVIFWFKDDKVTGTYIAEKPPEGQSDGAHIYFGVPALARESKDMYYGVDHPDGLNLDDLRQAMTYNVGNFYLPALVADRMEVTWNRLGFKRGDNPLPYNVIYRTLPDAVREVNISGPSFGPRKLQARTINNNLLLSINNRADMELWEGFSARLTRPSNRRERLSRAEAISFSVE